MICGKDPDEVFAYQTPKVVILRDRRLGLIALGLKVAIFLYIFVFQIFYKGEHLLVSSVDGIFRLSLQHPTVDMCDPFHTGCMANYTNIGRLPYCSQSEAPYAATEGRQARKRLCQIWDSVESTQAAEQGVMVPTRIRRFEQLRGCNPSQSNHWSCNSAPYDFNGADGKVQQTPGRAEPKFDAFVADIERFTLLIDHAFRRRGGMQADDNDMNGHWLECRNNEMHTSDCKRRPVVCTHGKCPRGAETADEPGARISVRPRRGFVHAGQAALLVATEQGAMTRDADGTEIPHLHPLPNGHAGISVKKGDVFTVGTLLGLGQVHLDEFYGYRDTLRARGGVIVIHIVYSNRPAGGWLGLRVTPWRAPFPHYDYRITVRPATDYKTTKSYDDPAQPERSVRVYNGIRIAVEQSGSIAKWDTMFFLMSMTASLALMAVATTLTDALLIHAMPHRDAYARSKFSRSKDFSHEGSPGRYKPTTKAEAGDLFLEAVETGNAAGVVDAVAGVLSMAEAGKQ